MAARGSSVRYLSHRSRVRQAHPAGPLLNSRAPKGSIYLLAPPNKSKKSRACLRILNSRAPKVSLTVEPMAALTVLLVPPFWGPYPKRELLVSSHVPHPIRSRERECIYYICHYAISPQLNKHLIYLYFMKPQLPHAHI